jgi:hypothetical protein
MTGSDRQAGSQGAALALGAAMIGSGVLMSAPANAEPPVPPNVWFQCSVFKGPNSSWPHPLKNCVSARGTVSGYTQNEGGAGSGLERIIWTEGFLAGETFQLTNITNSPVGVGTGCPSTHPIEVNVAGTISATEPGTKQYDGSPVAATICTDGNRETGTFILKPGTSFTIFKK